MRLDLGDYTQRRIYYGCHEPLEMRAVKRLLRPGDVALDVGANVGLFTLLAADAVGSTGEVHAFEPVPATFAELNENVRINGFEQVRLTRAAVGAAPGETTLGLGEHPEGGSGGYMTGGTGAPVEAPVVTLDGYVAQHLPDAPIRLLKVDVEGAEPDVLLGFRERLSVRPPDIVVAEVSPETLGLHGHNAASLLEQLTGSGYRLHRLGPRGRLRPLRSDEVALLAAPNVSQQSSDGLVGLFRQGLAERKTFFNVFALQPLVS
jgi:FkbM family methyltransferase